ncbi:hypothetical protein BGZ80_004748 [Entomortierella chlamydospora]|uniref:Kelch repeat protein n=1 Tax=Entomortierella chlamydospora TaxID=101097 RepID=A0A9P6T2C9_9FUNG|nr:hypothetical protein BGZ80_004748 [Entomortierella chlamydospora]
MAVMTELAHVDGSRYYFFGGQADTSDVNATVYGDLLEYDVGTSVWGTLAPIKPRSHMACAAAGKAFVVWSGRADGNSTLAPMFDFATGAWIDSFHGTTDPTGPGSTAVTTLVKASEAIDNPQGYDCQGFGALSETQYL